MSNKPLDEIQEVETMSYLNIVDLSSGQLIFSQVAGSMIPSWSPDSNRFLFIDSSGNIIFYDIKNNDSKPITLSMMNYEIQQIDWSYDGFYFMIQLSEKRGDRYYPSAAIIETP